MELTISLGQMNVALGQPARNLETVEVLAAEAAARGSDVLVLPELWSTGYDLGRAREHATPVGEGMFAAVADLARKRRLYIAGSLLGQIAGSGAGNTAVLYGPDGRLLATYNKIHLFRLMDEEQYLCAGNELALAETPWGKSGLAICYDLRFPEQFRAYALAGATIVFLPSEWPHPRLDHWRTLLRARAIENQLFVVACNRVGQSGETHFFGHSTIVDPWGEPVVEGGEEAVLLTATIDTARVDEIRARIPIFKDRRPDIYGSSL
jgi:predicted amidohydrolase